MIKLIVMVWPALENISLRHHVTNVEFSNLSFPVKALINLHLVKIQGLHSLFSAFFQFHQLNTPH